MQPTHQPLLARLIGLLRGLFGPPTRQLPPPPIMARPKLPPRPPPSRVEVVSTRAHHNPWDALMDFGPEERTTLIEKPARLTSPGLNDGQHSAHHEDTAQPTRPAPPEAAPMRPAPHRLPLR